LRPVTRFALASLCLLIGPVSITEALGINGSVSMKTIEGRVVAVERYEAEGGVEVLMARIDTGEGAESGTQILLAPKAVCQDIGFEIEEGDRLRARVFIATEGPSRVQKVQNFTRGTMVRLRTLHSTPLWSAAGTWQGGPIRTARGQNQAGPGAGKGPPR